MDNDILQEFLAESRELLADAQAQLLRLEAAPGDAAVLGAIFRAFHTLKGGAGFLEAASMVDWCHHLEDLLDKLRSGKLQADGGMIDAILRSTDVIERMLGEMAQGENPAPGPGELGALVKAYASGQQPAAQAVRQAPPAAGDALIESVEALDPEPAGDGTWVETRAQASGEPGVYVQKKTSSPAPAPAGAGGEEDLEAEFERMLDSVYGKGVAPGSATSAASALRDPLADDAGAAPLPATTGGGAGAAPPGRGAQPAPAGGAAQDAADTTIRVDSARLDQAMNQVGELVLLRNRLSAAVSRLGQSDETLARLARETDLAVNDLQNTVMRLRMQPCKRLFQSLPRVVRDASRSLGKKVRLELAGEDVEIDKTVIDALSGPLIHLVRNALDHGLEPPEQRVQFGKPEEGVLRVQAVHLGDKVQIHVSDDGRGMDGHRIVQSALSKGLITESDAARLSEREMLDLIFLPGFSTKEQVSELSGRGVGMDVVRSAVQGLRGRVDITTRANQGTQLSLELPLTLAVLPVLYFKLRRETYALPVSVVDNLMEIDPQQVHSISGRLMAQVGPDRIVPFIDLGLQLQGVELRLGHDPCEGILTEHGLLVVSEALGTEDSVVKPLDISSQTSWYQGATISGGGDVVLILDIAALTRAMRTPQAA